MSSSTPASTRRARRRRRGGWIQWICLLAGVLLLCYPKVAEAIRTQRDAAVVQGYESKAISAAERKRLAADVKRYNASLADGRFNTTDPFSTGRKQSHSTFSAAGEVIGVLKLPTLKLELPVYYGTDEISLAKGAGMLENTSYPGTKGGNAVITGHRGMHDAQLFRHLEKLQPGDAFYFVDKLQVKKYVVRSHEVVLPSETGRITTTPGRDLVTLLTCDPYLRNTHRLLVHAERGTLTRAELEALKPSAPPATGHEGLGAVPLGIVETLAWVLGVLVLVGLGRGLWLLLARRRRREQDDEPPRRAA